VLRLSFVWWQPKDLVEFIQLINQLINKFKTGMRDILQEIFPAVVGRIFALLPQEGFPEGPGSHTEVGSTYSGPGQVLLCLWPVFLI
jgi:hypothetical protein